MSRRAWCQETGPPRSREASGSNPRLPTGSNRQILSHALSASANAGERETPAAEMRWVGLVQSGCEAFERRFKSRRWDSDQSRKANRVKSSTGSFNARWRRELPGGDTEEPEADNFRGSAKKTQTVKSSTMRGAQALASKRQQRRSQIGNRLSRADRSSLLYSNDRNQRVVARWKLCRSGSFGHAWQVRTQCRPTYVTAVVKNRNNRARSLASGVVSGAGCVNR